MELEASVITLQELKNHFVVTDLELVLKMDKAGAELDRIEQAISEWTAEVESRKRAALPPEQFFQVNRLLSSLHVAQHVVRRAWKQHHAR
jgi:cob(I)alamin adenosyltransferase